MWSPWMSARFGIRKRDIEEQNITIPEIVGMWDAVKE